MKVVVKEGISAHEYTYGSQTSLDIEIDGKGVFSMYELCECPEDATFARDLADCNCIPSLLQKAYNAGKAGEEFSIEYLTEED